jgi:hypothetical protein
MGQVVQDQGMEAGIAKGHLKPAAGCRVFI